MLWGFLCCTMCMKENLIHYRTCVCNINYHVVWSVKYRRKIFTPEIEQFLADLVQEIAADKGLTVHQFECGERATDQELMDVCQKHRYSHKNLTEALKIVYKARNDEYKKQHPPVTAASGEAGAPP